MQRDTSAAARRNSLVALIAMSFVWLAAWFWIQGAVGVWIVMFLVYVFSLAVVILFGPPPGRSSAFDAWRSRFFRTGGVVVVSGVLSVVYLMIFGLVLVLIGGV